MRHPLRSSVLCGLLLLAPAACDFSDQGGPRIETPGAEAGAEAGDVPADTDDVFSIHSTDGSVKLGLTEGALYMRLSDEMLRRAESKMANDTTAAEHGLAGALRTAVTGAVSRVMRTRISFDHDDVRDVRWDDEGGLVVELESGEVAFGDMDVNNQDVNEKFAEDDVEAFAEEWRKVKGDAESRRSGSEADAPGGGG